MSQNIRISLVANIWDQHYSSTDGATAVDAAIQHWGPDNMTNMVGDRKIKNRGAVVSKDG